MNPSGSTRGRPPGRERRSRADPAPASAARHRERRRGGHRHRAPETDDLIGFDRAFREAVRCPSDGCCAPSPRRFSSQEIAATLLRHPDRNRSIPTALRIQLAPDWRSRPTTRRLRLEGRHERYPAGSNVSSGTGWRIPTARARSSMPSLNGITSISGQETSGSTIAWRPILNALAAAAAVVLVFVAVAGPWRGGRRPAPAGLRRRPRR